MKAEPLVVERIYNAPAEKVWDAITDKEKIKVWSFDMDAFVPKVGFEFRFYGEKDGRKFLHICKVLDVVPQRRLKFSWRYENFPGQSFVTYELFPEVDKTKFRLTHEEIESFPADNDDFSRANFTMGWNQIVGTLLKDFVEK